MYLVEHRLHRGIVHEAFSRRSMQNWMPRVIEPVVDAHVSAFEKRGRADLVSELTFSFPVLVIGEMLGLPSEDLPEVPSLGSRDDLPTFRSRVGPRGLLQSWPSTSRRSWLPAERNPRTT